MKKFAFYLPQFHEIPENNEWWGKGFTEWTNVKKAKPLFKGHHQPIVPLNNNYYDLSDINTLKWQANIAREYGVSGMIFYHYYFMGRKLLEKPAELLLSNKSIDMKFFFCWANHSWFRTWENSKTLLIKQEYGNEEIWQEHFNYLLPFFKDERYEKKDNKPLFMIFSNDIDRKNDMFEFFDKKCKENGFEGIALIETTDRYKNKDLELLFNNVTSKTLYIHLREPNTTKRMYMKTGLQGIIFRMKNKVGKFLRKIGIKYIEKYDGNALIKLGTKYKTNDKRIIRGLCFEWDNTPRHGYRGFIITPFSKKLFLKYIESIRNDEYLFIDAWNEWCEGMILEPTILNEFKYLSWLKEID